MGTSCSFSLFQSEEGNRSDAAAADRAPQQPIPPRVQHQSPLGRAFRSTVQRGCAEIDIAAHRPAQQTQSNDMCVINVTRERDIPVADGQPVSTDNASPRRRFFDDDAQKQRKTAEPQDALAADIDPLRFSLVCTCEEQASEPCKTSVHICRLSGSGSALNPWCGISSSSLQGMATAALGGADRAERSFSSRRASSVTFQGEVCVFFDEDMNGEGGDAPLGISLGTPKESSVGHTPAICPVDVDWHTRVSEFTLPESLFCTDDKEQLRSPLASSSKSMKGDTTPASCLAPHKVAHLTETPFNASIAKKRASLLR